MITPTTYRCPEALIDNALEYPISDWRISINKPTGNFFYDPWEIKPEFKDSPWDTILKSLPINIGEARIITLEPGASYNAHADIDNRYHLNLTGEFCYLIDLDNEKMFNLSRDNIWYDMDAGLMHTASNFGNVPRRQLVVRQLLKHATVDTISVTMGPNIEYNIRYYFDKLISPWLNKTNSKGFLDEFNYSEYIIKFKIAKHLKDEFLGLDLKYFKVEIDETSL